MPQPQRADIPALVRRLTVGSAAEQAQAALALYEMEHGGSSQAAIAAAIAEAGGIPALLQLIGSHREHPGIAAAVWLLGVLADRSSERCQAIIAADGIAPLVRCLESSSQAGVQAAAAGALVNIAASDGGGQAGVAAIAAAGAIPAAIRRLSSSDDLVLQHTVNLLCRLSTGPDRKRAIASAGGISLLVRLLRHRSQAVTVDAVSALVCLTFGDGSEPCAAAIEAAGGIPPLVELAATSSDADTVQAAVATVLNVLKFSPDITPVSVIEAGGIPALVRCLQGEQFTSTTHECVGWCLCILTDSGAQASRAIADAGGARALVQALTQPGSPDVKAAVADALGSLVLSGQAAAVAAADPSNAVAAALEWLPSSPVFTGTPQARAQLAEALRLLTAARVCAAPGCGATAGLKRCAGCGSERYCGEACMRAHWREHRPECKRLRAAAAADGAAGPSGRA